MRLHLEAIEQPADGYQPQFESHKDELFDGGIVLVDNRQFGNCRFVSCNFVYSGGPFGFFECEIEGQCILSLTGPAHKTMQLNEALLPLFRRNFPRT
jgi:hypothetical protein